MHRKNTTISEMSKKIPYQESVIRWSSTDTTAIKIVVLFERNKKRVAINYQAWTITT